MSSGRSGWIDLLVYLAERAGRLVEKQALMSALWPDAVVEEANLAYNVSALRTALGDGHDGEHIIQTVPTRGYRFIAPVRERRRDNSAPPAGPRPGRTLVVAQSGVFVVPASGGALEALAKTRPDEGIPSWPELLPGGRHLLFSVWRVDPLPPVGTA